jgi:hypothetical protein
MQQHNIFWGARGLGKHWLCKEGLRLTVSSNYLQYIYVVVAEQRVGNDDNATRVLPNNTPSSCRERKVESRTTRI